MYIHDERSRATAEGRSLDADKELKVRIPVEQHLMLHSLKVLTGKPISEAVSEALAAYFAGTLHERGALGRAAAVGDAVHGVD